MDLIKLTGLTSRCQIWINLNNIVSIEDRYNVLDERMEGSEILLVGGSKRYVKESVEDIVAMISVLKVSSSSLHCLTEFELKILIEELERERSGRSCEDGKTD